MQWKRVDDAWEVSLGSGAANFGPVVAYVLIALANAAHSERPLYDETPGATFNKKANELTAANSPDEAEQIKKELLQIDRALGNAILIDLLVKDGYLSDSSVRAVEEFQSGRILLLEDSLAHLGLIATLRRLDQDISEFHEKIIAQKSYAILPLLDRIELSLESRHARFSDVAEIHTILGTGGNNHQQFGAMIVELKALTQTEGWRSGMRYDLVISFAGEDRAVAESIAEEIRGRGYRVFYDRYSEAELWGKDLYSHLADVYQNRGRYCLMIVSKYYSKKNWTNHERKSAQARAFEESREYILPLRLDDTDIDGVLQTTGYVDFRTKSIDEVVDLLVQKIEAS